jgi:hypothetical protein
MTLYIPFSLIRTQHYHTQAESPGSTVVLRFVAVSGGALPEGKQACAHLVFGSAVV